jgi:hypothetical protein
LLIAPSYKWQALPTLIQNDPYLQGWNETIFGNATDYYSLPPVIYFMDGDSGILDNARSVKMRIKAFAYAYRMTNDTKWVDRAWAELQVSYVHFMHITIFLTLLLLIRMPPAMEQHLLDLPRTSGILATSSTPLNFAPRSVSPTIGSTTCGLMTKRVK